MKNKMKKGILALLVVFVMLFTLFSNVIAVTIVGGDTHTIGNSVSFTTTKEFNKVQLTGTTYNEELTDQQYETSTEAGVTTITLLASYTETLEPDDYLLQLFLDYEQKAMTSFSLIKYSTDVTVSPTNPLQGRSITFSTKMPKNEFVSASLGGAPLTNDDYYLDETSDLVILTLKATFTEMFSDGNYTINIEGTNGTIPKKFTLSLPVEYEVDPVGGDSKVTDGFSVTTNIPEAEIINVQLDGINLEKTKDYTTSEALGVTTVNVLPKVSRLLTIGQHTITLLAADGDGETIVHLIAGDYTVTFTPVTPVVGNAIRFTTNIDPSIINDMTIGEDSLTFDDIIPDQDEETGDTIITVKPEYTNKLSATSYEVKIIAINGEATTTLEFKPIEYEVTEILTDAVADGSIVFVADAPFDHFLGFQIDGKTVDPAHYDADEGSIIITLFKKYISKYITPGKTHTITFVLTSGNATKTFKAGNAITAKNPDTGDNLVVFIAIALVVLIVLFIVVKLLQKNKKK